MRPFSSGLTTAWCQRIKWKKEEKEEKEERRAGRRSHFDLSFFLLSLFSSDEKIRTTHPPAHGIRGNYIAA
ncbi:hypothetical protein [Sphingorhabdus contaminans]|uniref:Uncharacterized protein n=1 Tax=Sphingorhabdus contaminans TaxID=1343899 RepID=A0A553W9T4_9SPHN|nr:hypothetical protein [Sphingorhabdus contaminans]TSB01436.1 hypothetical protein FOM92_09565 [Sphingorhabdus contaminans]